MPKISGVWKWNDSLPFQAYNETNNITFISGGQSYTSLSFETGGDPRLETEYSNMKYGDAVVAQGMNGANLSFISSNYQTVDFGLSPQEVSQIFYEVLTENAVQQSTPTTVKAVSSANLAEFKAKCDETYAAVGNIPTVSTELVNLGTLSTSGTLTADQATQIGTTTVGVTARASVNSVTRFYERVNISGTTAMLISADDDALHVLTVNLSTRAYTLSDVPLGGGGDTPDIPTPSASDNGDLLGVSNGAYVLIDPSSLTVGNATNATNDRNGDNIVNTYVKKSALKYQHNVHMANSNNSIVVIISGLLFSRSNGFNNTATFFANLMSTYDTATIECGGNYNGNAILQCWAVSSYVLGVSYLNSNGVEQTAQIQSGTLSNFVRDQVIPLNS